MGARIPAESHDRGQAATAGESSALVPIRNCEIRFALACTDMETGAGARAKEGWS